MARFLATAQAIQLSRRRDHFHMEYHHGKGDTIIAKKLHVEIDRPKVIRMDVVAAQESGRAKAM
jgi:hypothetical protein